MHMKKRTILKTSAMTLLMASAVLLGLNTNNVQASTNNHVMKTAVTKIAGKKNYKIYRHVSVNGATHVLTNTKYFKHAHLEAKESYKTKKGTYWLLIVNGRSVGWVHQNFFARSKMSLAKNVSLVYNEHYNFLTKDAINYVTDKTGTLINPNKVHISQKKIHSDEIGEHTVTYKYGKAKETLKITVRGNHNEGIANSDQEAKGDLPASQTWSGSSLGSSRNWNAEHGFSYETSKNDYQSSNGEMTLSTVLYQPRFLSLDYHMNDFISQVGTIPEGTSVKDGIAVTSLLASSKRLHGYLVSYDLNQISNLYDVQRLTSMPFNDFKNYSEAIKVSSYLKLGHGQALGQTDQYIYVLANNDKLKNSPKSEEIMQIRKSDMGLNKIWTIKAWNGESAFPRYFHNATFVDDNTMYGLFHNSSKHCYEYWKLEKQGDEWIPTEIGATNSDLITNSPVQGFTYDQIHDKFYVGFNDHLFKLNSDGTPVKDYAFDTKRELEGISADNGTLYAQLAKRNEWLTTPID